MRPMGKISASIFSASVLLIAIAGKVLADPKPGLQDVIVAHTAGHVSVSYDKGNEKYYSNLLYWELKRAIGQAESECLWAHQEVDQRRANYLSDKIKSILHSLKAADGSYSDYLIVSGLLRKYAGRLTRSNTPTFSSRQRRFGGDDKISSIDVRASGFFVGRCPEMAGALLAKDGLPIPVLKLVKSDLCSSLNELKACYRELDSLHARATEDRRLHLKIIEKGKFDAQQGMKGTVQ